MNYGRNLQRQFREQEQVVDTRQKESAVQRNNNDNIILGSSA